MCRLGSEILRLIQKNRDYLAALSFKGASVFKGPALMVLLVTYLTPEEQGFWFLITNLGAIVYMADFGLGVLTMQTIANFQSLDSVASRRMWDAEGVIQSSYNFLFKSVLLTCFFVAPVGVYLIGVDKHAILQAWFFYLLSSLPVHFFLLRMHILQGFGDVFSSFLYRSLYIIFSLVICSVLLWSSWSLMSIGVANFIGGVVFIFLTDKFKKTVVDISLGREKVPTRIGRDSNVKSQYILSWVSGYIMFFLIVPVILQTQGPIAAGQIGLGLAMTKAVSAISLAPIEAKISSLGSLYSQRRFVDFQRLYSTVILVGVSFFLVGAVTILLVTWWLLQSSVFHDRVPSFSIMSALLATEFIYLCMSFMAKRIRMFLVEPFAGATAVLATVVVLSCYFVSASYSLKAWAVSYFLIYFLIGLPIFYVIYHINLRRFIRADDLP